MALLFKDASGQLVIAASLPPGGSAVAGPASSALADVAPWLRALDSNGSSDWHPATYYSDGGEAAGTITGYLTRPAVTLAANSSGAVSDFSAAAGNFYVYLGGVDITAQCTFSSSAASNLTASINSAGAYSATALSADVGSIQFTATYKNRTVDVVFTVAKARAGIDGADGADGSAGTNARAVTLTATTLAVDYNTAGASPSPSSVTLTATALNAAGTVYYQFFKNDVSVQNSTSNTYNYVPQALYDNMPDKIEVQIREGASTGPILARDMVNLVGLKAGANAITIVLSNEAHTLPTTNAGVVTYTGSGTTIKVWEGTTALTEDSVAAYANGTFRVSASGAGITVGSVSGAGTQTLTYGNHSAMTTDTATVTFSITVKNSAGVETTFTRLQSLSKSKQGADGTNGADGANGTRGSGEFYATGSSWSDTAANAAVTAVYPTGKVYGDTVTISNGTTFAMTKYWNGSAWTAPGTVIDGNLLVSGTVSAAKINSNGLTIRDTLGNVVLSASATNALDFAKVGGTTKPEDGATVGGTFGVNIDGQMNSGNVSTWIANAAIGSLILGVNSVCKLSSASVGSVSVAANTLTQVVSVTYTSTIPTARQRALFVSGGSDGPLSLRVIRIQVTCGAFSEYKDVFYNGSANADSRLHAGSCGFIIPAGYSSSVTVSYSVTHSAAGTESNANLSVLEVLI
jgi:hypothetical protein